VHAVHACGSRAARNRALCPQVTTDFAYLPFGGGRRKCIGEQFALFEAVVALAMLQRRFSFELDPAAEPVGMTTGATIHTTAGLNVKLRPRAGADSSVDEVAGAAAAAAAAAGCGHASGCADSHKPSVAPRARSAQEALVR
jgi:beta-ring hydroxylase